jgi:hypothetical protein
MRYTILFLFFISLYAHEGHEHNEELSDKLMDVEVGLEAKYTINDDLQNYKISGLLLDRESEIAKEDFEFGHLSLGIYKEFSKNLKSKFEISNHKINSTYIEEAFVDYLTELEKFNVNFKVGKFYSNFAFLNKHLHDTFVDKPIMYKLFSDDLNDEGFAVGVNYDNFYFTLENLSGDEFPAKDSNKYLLGAILANLSYKKVISNHHLEFRIFGFDSEANGRVHTQKLTHTHSNNKIECSDVDAFCFSGDVYFYGAGVEYKFEKLKVLSEYIHKKEDGYLRDRLQKNDYISRENAFYIEGSYEILNNLIFGLRYNLAWSDKTLSGTNVENLAKEANLASFTPEAFNILLNYKFNKFNSFKVQYDINDLYKDDNNQLSFAYVLDFDF